VSNPSSFSLLIEVYHWLDELFLDHRLVQLSLDLPAISARLTFYESHLRLPLADEVTAPRRGL